MKFLKQHNPSLGMLLLAGVLVISIMISQGCSYNRMIQSEVDNWSKTVLDREARFFQSGETSSLPESAAFETAIPQLLNLVMQQAPKLNGSRFDIKLGEIHRQQIESQKWPRLNLNTTLNVPLDDSSYKLRDVLYGGLFIEYDLIDAFFNTDSEAIAESMIRRSLEQQEKASKNVENNLMDCLLDIWHFSQVHLLYESDIESVKKGVDLTQQLYILEKVDIKTVVEWQARLRTAVANRNQAAERIETEMARLKYMAGLQNYRTVSISDISNITNILAHATQDTEYQSADLYRTLHQNSDVKIAEINLFIAEMSILATKKSRLPKLSAGLGLGSQNLYTSLNDAAVVVRLGINLPILDAGDAGRRIRTAEIQRDRERQKVVDLVHRISVDLQDAYRQIRSTRDKLLDAESWYRQQKEWADRQLKLDGLNRLGTEEVLMAELALNAARLERAQALYSHYKALIQWKKAVADHWVLP